MAETLAPQRDQDQTVLASWELPGRPEFVSVARAFLRVLLAEHPQVDTVEWLLSEVFSNSVQHSTSGTHDRGTVCVGLSSRADGWIRLEVADEGGLTAPEDRAGDLNAESGRGWHLVKTLAEECGSEAGGWGRITWFTMGSEPLASAEYER